MELRDISLEALFGELKYIGIPLTQAGFDALSATYDNPEEMALDLCVGNERVHSSLLPIIFEIWRRLCPGKQTISTFGKELDYLIETYENGISEELEHLYHALAQLHTILDENSETGISPHDAFDIVQQYVDYDLESFLYIFILNEIETGELSYALDLLEGFMSYVQDKIWFQYLYTRALISDDLEEGYKRLERLIEDLKEENNLDLNLEVLSFLSQSGHHTLFLQLALHTIFTLETEEDFSDFAEIAKEHFHTLELGSLADQITHLIAHRPPRPANFPFSIEDPDLLQLHKILTQKVLVL